MLCCCRCFKRRKAYEGPFSDDIEREPIVVKQVVDGSSVPSTTHMEPIPETSPRPSDDTVQRAISLPQDADSSTRAPSMRPTSVVEAPPTPPPESDVVAPLERAVSVPPTPPETLPTTTALTRTSSPALAQLIPPAYDSTPSPDLLPTSVQHTPMSPPSSPLRMPTSDPPPPDSQPKIDPSPAPPQPSLFARIKTMFIPGSGDEEATAQTDGTTDRLDLLPRVAVRLSPPKRAPKAAVPTWCTEVWS